MNFLKQAWHRAECAWT